MQVPCSSCGAELRLNPKLSGTTVSCPQCGSRMLVPDAAPEPVPEAPRRRTAAREPARQKAPTRLILPEKFTLWLLGAQVTLAVLGLTCLAGAFLKAGWNPPGWSYFHENAMVLVAVGIALVFAGWLAHYLPIVTTLGVAVFVLCACAMSYVGASRVDASRAIALSVAMLALWLALQHKRAVA